MLDIVLVATFSLYMLIYFKIKINKKEHIFTKNGHENPFTSLHCKCTLYEM